MERLLKDDEAEVRAAAVRALAIVRGEAAIGLMRPHLDDRDPRLAVTAATALAASSDPADVDAAEATLERLSSDSRQSAVDARARKSPRRWARSRIRASAGCWCR